MKKIMIEVGGKAYPCRLTMGAMLLFKQNTGKDVSQIDLDNVEEAMRLMWCCVVSQCRAEGVDFEIDFQLFCDLLSPEDVARWNQALAENTESEKKSEG